MVLSEQSWRVGEVASHTVTRVRKRFTIRGRGSPSVGTQWHAVSRSGKRRRQRVWRRQQLLSRLLIFSPSPPHQLDSHVRTFSGLQGRIQTFPELRGWVRGVTMVASLQKGCWLLRPGAGPGGASSRRELVAAALRVPALPLPLTFYV